MPKQLIDYIEIRLVDGTKLTASGEHAQEVWDWWKSCETMNCIHGAEYRGKQMVIEMKP